MEFTVTLYKKVQVKSNKVSENTSKVQRKKDSKFDDDAYLENLEGQILKTLTIIDQD